MQERKITLIDIGAGALPSVTPVTAQNSSWFPTVYVSPETPPVDGVTPEPVADGVLIEWDAVDQAGVVYIIERGPSQNGPWTEIHRTTETRYLYSDGSGQKWYFRITASVRGKPGQGTVVEATPAPTTAQLVTAQQKLDKEIVDRALADANEAAARARDIGSVNASLVLEAQTRVTQIGQAMDAIAAEGQTRATDLLNEKLEREAAITAVSETQQNGFDSLSRALSEVAAGSGTQFDSKRIWDFNLTVESWTGNGAPALVDGWLRPANAAANPYVQSPGGLGIDGSGYRFVKMRIKKVGNPTWAGALQWTTTTDATWNTTKRVTIAEPAWDGSGVAILDVADIAWRPSTIAAVRLQLGAAQGVSDYYLIDWLAIGRPMPAASVALVQEETQARVTALASEATQRNTLAVQMRGNYTGTDLSQAQGLMGDERTARAAADSSQVQRITTIEARMPAGNGGLATSASVTTLQDAMVAADQANAQATTAVNSKLTGLRTVGDNLLPNSNFAENFLWWVLGGNSGGNTILRDAASGDGGPGVTITRATAAIAPFMDANDGAFFPVRAGTIFRARVRVKLLSGNGNVLLRVVYRNAENTQFQADRTITATAEWTDFTVDYGALPAGSVRALFRVYVHPSIGTVSFDRVELYDVTDQAANQLTAAGLQSITTRTGVIEGTLVAQGSALTQVQADVAGKASNAALTSLDSKVTQLGSTVTSQGTALTNVTASLQNIGGDNLLANSGFEQNGLGWYAASGSTAGATISRSYVDSALPGSAKAARWEIANLASPGGYYEFYSLSTLKSMKVDPAKKHTMSAYVRGTPGVRVFLQFQWRDAAGAIIGYTGTPASADRVTTADWARHTWTGTAPATASTCNVYIRIYGANSPDQWVEWDNIQVQVGEIATGYVPSIEEIASATAANADATSTLTGKVTVLEGTITAQGQAITSVNAQLAATQQAGPNIMIDAGFEGYASEQIISAVGGNGEFRAKAGNAGSSTFEGSRVGLLRRTITPAAGNTDIYFGPSISTVTGRTYYIEAVVRNNTFFSGVAPGDAVFRFGVSVLNSSGARSWHAGVENRRLDSLSQWTRISAYVTVTTPNTRTGQLWLSIPGTQPAGGLTVQNVGILVDNVIWQDVTDAYGAKTTADAAATGLSALTTTVTQQGGQITALGQQVNQVGASVGEKADASTVQTLTATVKGSMAGGGNLIPNTMFKDGASDWVWAWNDSGFWENPTVNLLGDNQYWPPGMNALGFRSLNAGSPPAGQTRYGVIRNRVAVPVAPGKRYCSSVWLNPFRCEAVAMLTFYNANNQMISEHAGAVVPRQDSTTATLASLPRGFVVATAPAGAVKACMGWRAQATGPQHTTPYLWGAQPMLEEMRPEQVGPSPWSAGGSESFAGYSMYVTADGLTGGMVMKNDGRIVDMKILANVFQILSPNQPDGIEMRDGYIRVWKGNSQRIIGNGFGNSGEGLIDYFGPNVGAAAASKANATVWMDVNGNAYWGGALAAGIRRNAAQSTSIVTIGNFVTVGPFDTNGRNKQVVISYSRTVRATKNALGPDGFRPGGGANSATVNVYRRIGAAGEVLWGQVQAGGNLDIRNEPDSPDVLISRWSGSLTLNDSADGTAQRTYRAEVVAFSSQSYSHDSGNWDASTTSQSLSIVSIED
jgi:hypothetical protein